MNINREHIVGAICIAIAAAVLLVTPSFPEGQAGVNLTGPAFFPNLLAYIFVVLGVFQLLAGIRLARSAARTAAFGAAGAGATGAAHEARAEATAASDGPNGKAPRRLLLFLALIAGFIAFLNPFGFIPTTLTFLFLLLMLFGVKPLKSALFSVIFTAVIYLMFGMLFTIGLPAGILSFLGI